MGLLTRLGALFRGFLGIFVGGLEQKNPEFLFEDIKLQIEKSRKQAEQQIIDIQTNAELIKIEMNNASKNLEAVKARIQSAQRTGDREILVELLVQEEELQTTFDTHKATYDNAMIEVAKIRENYKIFESEMNAKLNEIKTLKSQAKMAQLRENINSVNSRLSNSGNKIGEINSDLERAREIVNTKTARANAIESLGDTNTELKLKKLDMNSARERALARAEAMLNNGEGFEVKEKIQEQNDNNNGNNNSQKQSL